MPRESPFGKPLSDEAKAQVAAVRERVVPMHPNFNTEFNVYRFILAAERLHKKEENVIKYAAVALNNHLRYRKTLNLDVEYIPSFEENPIFIKKLMPKGDILEKTDASNRLLWYIEYATITVESIAHSIRSTESCKFQFLQFEYMLRKVMEQEERTGKMSSLRHVVDMSGYEINPFTMVFVSNGTLAYYSQLFHFENYPELVVPVDMVNISKWIHLPYKLAKTMMPAGFTDKFRLHDRHFLSTLTEDIDINDIPVSLGGNDTSITFTDAIKVNPEEYWSVENAAMVDALEGFHIGPRKQRHVVIDITTSQELKWYFCTDGDVFFGVYYENGQRYTTVDHDDEDHFATMEMAYPWLKVSAKLVHEVDGCSLNKPGRYHILFSNKHSWLHKKTIQFYGQLYDHSTKTYQRIFTDGSMVSADPMIQ